MKITVATLALTLAVSASLADSDAPESSTDAETQEGSNPAETENYPLPPVLVRSKQVLVATPLIVREATRQDIVAWNARDAVDVLKHVPGLSVQNSRSGDYNLTARGFRHRDLLVLFDGIPIASAYEGSIDLREIPTSNLDRVRVLKSAPSVIYGPNGMGGVFDFVPMKGRNEVSEARFEWGENQSRYAEVNLGGALGSANFFLSAGYADSDGFDVPSGFVPDTNEDGGLREQSDYRRANLFGYANGVNGLGRSSLFFTLSDNERGTPPEIGVDDADFERLDESWRQTVGFSHRFDALPLTVKLYDLRASVDLEVFDDASYTTLDEVVSFDDHTWGATVFSEFDLSASHLVLASVGFKRDTFESERILRSSDQAKTDTWTVALESERSWGDSFSLAVGGMYNRFEQPQVSKSLDTLNFQAVAGYRIDPNWTLLATVADRTRLPKLRELYDPRRGNTDLDEQSTLNLDLGLQYHGDDGMRADVTVFRSRVEDMIDRIDRRGTYVNFDEITYTGIEAAYSHWLTRNVFLRLGYTWLDAEETRADGVTRQFTRRPEHSFYGDLRFVYEDWEATLTATRQNGLYDVDPDRVYVELDQAVQVDARVDWTVSGVGVYAAAGNLLDEYSEDRFGFPNPGRMLRIGVEFGF